MPGPILNEALFIDSMISKQGPKQRHTTVMTMNKVLAVIKKSMSFVFIID
jgi:hypothetical protein